MPVKRRQFPVCVFYPLLRRTLTDFGLNVNLQQSQFIRYTAEWQWSMLTKQDLVADLWSSVPASWLSNRFPIVATCEVKQSDWIDSPLCETMLAIISCFFVSSVVIQSQSCVHLTNKADIWQAHRNPNYRLTTKKLVKSFISTGCFDGYLTADVRQPIYPYAAQWTDG